MSTTKEIDPTRRAAALRIIQRDLAAINWSMVPDGKVIAVAVAIWGETILSEIEREADMTKAPI